MNTNFEFNPENDHELFNNDLIKVKQNTHSDLKVAKSINGESINICIDTQIDLGYRNADLVNTSLCFQTHQNEIMQRDENKFLGHDVPGLFFISEQALNRHDCSNLSNTTKAFSVAIASGSILSIDYENLYNQTLPNFDIDVKVEEQNLIRINSDKNKDIGRLGVFMLMYLFIYVTNNIHLRFVNRIPFRRNLNNGYIKTGQKRITFDFIRMYFNLSRNIALVVLLYTVYTDSWVVYLIILFHRCTTLYYSWNILYFLVYYKFNEQYRHNREPTIKYFIIFNLIFIILYLYSLKYHYGWHLKLLVIPTFKIYIFHHILYASEMLTAAISKTTQFQGLFANFLIAFNQHLVVNYF